jgi:ADP-ribosylglycohydrolase
MKGNRMTTIDATLTREARAEGALWGQACGDAFGMPNSFLKVPAWREHMEPGPDNSPYHAGYAAGRITDDTEQAQSLSVAFAKSSGHLDYRHAAVELEAWLDRVGGQESLAVGPSTKLAMARIKQGVPIEEAGIRGVTNGAPMRIAAVGVWAALHDFTFDELMADVHAACLPTHNTSVAISGAAAVAAAVWAGIKGASWAETIDVSCKAADAGEELGNWIYSPSVSARIRHGIELLLATKSEEEAARVVSEIVGMGEATAESVPAAFAIAAYADRDPGVAIRVAGNARGDTDTVAAMAGAISGAYSGASLIPADWRDDVARTNDLDVAAWVRDLANKEK